MSSASSTTRSSSRQSKDNKTLRRLGVDPSATLASAEKKNRGEMCKIGSYLEGGTLSLSQDGYLSFSDGSDWENNQNTPQKTTKKKRKKNRGAGKGAKKSELCYQNISKYYNITLPLNILIIIHAKPIHSRSYS